MASSDAQLIDDALAGNSAAFGQLVREYQDRLFNTMCHLLGCPEEAEDVVQDAMVQAYVKLDTFKRKSAFYTWLYRIAFNLAMSGQRRKRPTISVDQAAEQTGFEPADSGEGPDEPLERSERVAQVQAALATLDEDQRAILVLREMEGCHYDAIGDILSLPIGTVRSRLHRARIQLKQRLEQTVEDYS